MQYCSQIACLIRFLDHRMQSEEGRVGVKVCVTGAAGYIGSWLVKNLLHRGYTVNATLRDPRTFYSYIALALALFNLSLCFRVEQRYHSKLAIRLPEIYLHIAENSAKTGPLLTLPGAAERLKLFPADLCEEGSFDSAVEGCEGVFHVASPMDFAKLSEDDYVEPAVKGVLNVLNACSRAKSVRRVVYTSLVSAACPLNEEGELISGSCLDESRWAPVDFMRGTQHPGFVEGPWLTSTVPFSCEQILSLTMGNYEGLKLGQSWLGSIPLVHIDDVCEAHIFLMEQPNVEGRHICSAISLTVLQLADFIHKRYPQCLTLQSKSDHEDEEDGVFIPTSKKLLDIGFSYKHGLEDIFNDTFKYAEDHGLLK